MNKTGEKDTNSFLLCVKNKIDYKNFNLRNQQ